MTDAGGPVSFSLDEMASLIEDLMRIADDLVAGGDEVNAFLLDTVVNRLLDRAFGSGRVTSVDMPSRLLQCRFVTAAVANMPLNRAFVDRRAERVGRFYRMQPVR